MTDELLEREIKRAFERADGVVPSFERVWLQAAARSRRARRPYAVAAAAAAAIAALGIALWQPLQQRNPDVEDFAIVEALMNSTRWSAPSDALMPGFPTALYQGIPVMIESTETEEEALL